MRVLAMWLCVELRAALARSRTALPGFCGLDFWILALPLRCRTLAAGRADIL